MIASQSASAPSQPTVGKSDQSSFFTSPSICAPEAISRLLVAVAKVAADPSARGDHRPLGKNGDVAGYLARDLGVAVDHDDVAVDGAGDRHWAAST